MKTIRISALAKLALAAMLAVCLNAGRASAQLFAGKFTLPFEARWGLATLPPGDYSFKLDTTGFEGTLMLFRGSKVVTMIRCQSYSMERSGRSALTVIRSSAGNTVRRLTLPQIGEVLYYAPPKGEPVAAGRELAQLVPVTTPVR